MLWEPNGETESEGWSQYSLRVVSVCERSAGPRAESENNMNFATVIIFAGTGLLEYFGNPNAGASRIKATRSLEG